MMDRLSSEYRKRLEAFPEGLVDLSNIARTRRQAHERMDAGVVPVQLSPGVALHDELVPGVGRPGLVLRVYIPNGRATPSGALFFIHGGGFVMGRVWHFDAHCAEIASEACCLVAAIDYRLAPDDPYPAALDDCFDGLGFLVAAAGRLGIDPARVAVGGISAGAGLAAALALLARDRGGPAIAFQSLEAPMLDHRNITASSHNVDPPKVWNRTANELAWRAYLGEVRPVPAYASPAVAGDLSGLPPAYLAVSALELFFDEAVDYARRLAAAGVPVELHVYPNGFHGSAWALPDMPLSLRWRRDALGALRDALSGS